MSSFLGDTDYYSLHGTRNTGSPGLQSQAAKKHPLGAQVNIRALDPWKSSLLGEAGVLEHSKGRAQRSHQPSLHPWREFQQASKCVCVKLDSCPSGWYFNIRMKASLTFSLDVISCLWAGPWGGWICVPEPYNSGFSDCYSLVGFRMWALLVFKVTCFGDLSLKCMS